MHQLPQSPEEILPGKSSQQRRAQSARGWIFFFEKPSSPETAGNTTGKTPVNNQGQLGESLCNWVDGKKW